MVGKEAEAGIGFGPLAYLDIQYNLCIPLGLIISSLFNPDEIFQHKHLVCYALNLQDKLMCFTAKLLSANCRAYGIPV